MSIDGRQTAIDLFSGAGGLTEGLRQAGFSVIGAIELDALACETYLLNHAETQVWCNDIRTLDAFDVMIALGLKPGELDLLAGCPPCQGFSTLRTRRRTSSVLDDRNDLIFEFTRFVEAFQPKAIMMENVPNLARDERMIKMLNDLNQLGYPLTTNSVQVLDAAKFAVPQRRRRMILLAAHGSKLEFASECNETRTVRDAIGYLLPPGEGDDPLHDYRVKRNDRVVEVIQLIPHDGGSRRQLPDSMQLECHRRSNGFKDVYGRMAWDKVSPTITSGCFNPSRGRFLHPVQDRAITLREASLLQTFRRRISSPTMARVRRLPQ